MEVKKTDSLIVSAVIDLVHVLERMILLYQNFLHVLDEEYHHMVTLDLKSLTEATHAKEVLLAELDNLEKIRSKIVLQVSPHYGVAVEEANLLNLAEKLPKIVAEKLVKAREVLILSVSNAKEKNDRNAYFAEGSIERIDEMKKNVLGINGKSNKENYSNSGVRQPINEQGGRLLSTEA